MIDINIAHVEYETVYTSDTLDEDYLMLDKILAGNDRITRADGIDLVWGHTGNDSIYGNETIWGDAGHDKVYGGEDEDSPIGNLGNAAFVAATAMMMSTALWRRPTNFGLLTLAQTYCCAVM